MVKNKKKNKVKESCSDCEDKERRLAIQKLLIDVPYETKELYEGAVDSFYRSKMSLEDIKFIAGTMTPAYQRHAEAVTKERERQQIRRSGIY